MDTEGDKDTAVSEGTEKGETISEEQLKRSLKKLKRK